MKELNSMLAFLLSGLININIKLLNSTNIKPIILYDRNRILDFYFGLCFFGVLDATRSVGVHRCS